MTNKDSVAERDGHTIRLRLRDRSLQKGQRLQPTSGSPSVTPEQVSDMVARETGGIKEAAKLLGEKRKVTRR